MKRNVGPQSAAFSQQALALLAAVLLASSAGGAIETFQPNINGPISSVAVQADGKILIGGNFTAVNGVARPYLARLNSDGSSDTSFSPTQAPQAFVNRIVISDSNLFVGAGDGLRSFDLNGTLNWRFPMSVATFAVDPQQRVIIGGQFTRIENQAHRNLARLTAGGLLDTSFSPSIGCCAGEGVFALATVGDSVFVGGKFQSVNSVNVVSHMAKINADGSYDSGFTCTADPLVLTLAPLPDGKVFRLSESALARHLANGDIDPSFPPVTVDGVSVERFVAMAVQPDGKVIVGGFPAFAARFNLDGTTDNSFHAQVDGAVHSVAIEPSGDILLAGAFTQLNGEARTGLARGPNPSGSTVVPVLAMSRCASGAVILSWSQTPTTFSLEACELGGTAWTTVSGSPIVANGSNWFTNAAAGAGKFFRLAH